MAARFAATGVSFVFVYTREAHPGERYPHLTSMDQKLRHAREMASRDAIARPLLVDDLEGTVHHAYGRLPNMTYIVAGGGRLLYRASWTDAANLELVLEQVLGWRQARRDGAVQRPYYVEWEASVVADRQLFAEVLLETAGPRAVGEYIDAVEATMSAAIAAPLRQWWDATGGGRVPR